jgi:hypothetical protein
MAIFGSCLAITVDGVYLLFLFLLAKVRNVPYRGDKFPTILVALLHVIAEYSLVIIPIIIGLMMFQLWAMWQQNRRTRQAAWLAVFISILVITFLVAKFVLEILSLGPRAFVGEG